MPQNGDNTGHILLFFAAFALSAIRHCGAAPEAQAAKNRQCYLAACLVSKALHTLQQ